MSDKKKYLPVKFVKMNVLGNDFLIVEKILQNVVFSSNAIKKMADRKLGVGFDQLICLESPHSPDIDFSYRVFNADGSEVEQCLNGLRCLGHFCLDLGLIDRKEIRFENAQDRFIVTINSYNNSSVVLQKPNILETFDFNYDNDLFNIKVIDVGNPHALCFTDNKNIINEAFARKIQNSKWFPNSCNVSFVKVINRNSLDIVTFERGVGRTLCCGSAAVAASWCAIDSGLVDNKIKIYYKNGYLLFEQLVKEDNIKISGPVIRNFQGLLQLRKFKNKAISYSE